MRKYCWFLFASIIAHSSLGIEMNPSFSVESVKRYQIKADKGDKEAQYLYAVALSKGGGVQKDLAKAADYAQKSANQDFAPAYWLWGSANEYGWNGTTNVAVAARLYASFYKWAVEAAKENNAVAQYSVARCYGSGKGAEKDDSKAAEWLRKAAEQGMADAQIGLAKCYWSGTGVEKNVAQGMAWLCKAAEQGYAKAQYTLSLCYVYGDGVGKDPENAVRWMRKAAEQGYADAQFSLGQWYTTGEYVEKNDEKALSWFRKAAEQGVAGSQVYLGTLYYMGRGVSRNVIEAVKWFRRAAEQGDAIGQDSLGLAYELGDGIPKNLKMAALLHRKAAEQGYDCSQLHLGDCYENGIGVDKNVSEALAWYAKAAAQGNEDAKKAMERCKRSISGGDEEGTIANLLTKAKLHKTSTFVFKGFYLGMPISDAHSLLRYYDAGQNYRINSEGIVVADKSVRYATVVAQIKNGEIVEFRFSRRMVDRMFKTKGLPAKDFAQSMVNAYDAISELSPKFVEVANWKARKFTDEDVAEMARLAWASNAGVKDAGSALEEKAAETMSAKQTTLGYYCSNPQLGFELTIAPTGEPVKYQTDFFVVRKTCKVDVGNFD